MPKKTDDEKLVKLPMSELACLHLPEYSHFSVRGEVLSGYIQSRQKAVVKRLVQRGLMEYEPEKNGGDDYAHISLKGVIHKNKLLALPIAEYVKFVKLTQPQLEWLAAVGSPHVQVRLNSGINSRTLHTLLNYRLIVKRPRTIPLVGEPVDLTTRGADYLKEMKRLGKKVA